MITVSYDPVAGSLYWYMTDIEAGSTADEGECATTLLLDDAGQIIGLELELDESLTPDDLALALAHPEATFDRRAALLRILLTGQEAAAVQPLEEPAILDFDAQGRLQGCDVQPAPEFETETRLEQLAPFLIDVDEHADEHPAAVDQTPPPAAVPTAISPDYRSGFVAIIGRPNVGKSTLLNTLLGQKVAIVSPKPQTTRLPVRGILTLPEAQIVFVDTPGIHDPRTRLGSFMVEQARRAIPDADLVCFMVDITAPPNRQDRRIATLISRARAPHILVLNKVDRQHRGGEAHLQAYRELGAWDMEVAISALRRQGLETLLEEIVKRLPVGPPLYPTDQVTDQSTRERAAELVREQVLRYTQQEVPHSVAVEVEEWREEPNAAYIRMTIYVEKDSQKGIIIGAGGAMLKQIGSAARLGIEAILGRAVFLDLWVKARPNWRDDPSSLRWLGYSGS